MLTHSQAHDFCPCQNSMSREWCCSQWACLLHSVLLSIWDSTCQPLFPSQVFILVVWAICQLEYGSSLHVIKDGSSAITALYSKNKNINKRTSWKRADQAAVLESCMFLDVHVVKITFQQYFSKRHLIDALLIDKTDEIHQAGNYHQWEAKKADGWIATIILSQTSLYWSGFEMGLDALLNHNRYCKINMVDWDKVLHLLECCLGYFSSLVDSMRCQNVS